MGVDAQSFAEAFARPYQGERSTYGGQQWKFGSLLIGETGAPDATDTLPCDDPSGTKIPFDARRCRAASHRRVRGAPGWIDAAALTC